MRLPPSPRLLHELVAERAAATGDSPALTAGEVTIAYAELWERIAAFGAGLRELGVAAGDRIAIYLEKRIETVVAIFGASAAGAAFVPVNPVLRAAQVEHVLDDSGARLLVTSEARLRQLAERLPERGALEWVAVIDGPAEAPPRLSAELVPWGAVAEGEPCAPANRIDVEMAALLYTSGSTGRPKGVVLSHRNLVAGAASVCEYLSNDADDRILAALPLSFDAGLSQLTTGFAVGAGVVLLDYLLPKDAVRACAEHRITGLTCVPPLWIQLAEQEWPPEARESMRYFANTGGRLPRTTLERLRSLFPGAAPYLMYGLTEAFRSTYLDPAEVDRRPDSIGKAIPNAEVLVAREDGSSCAPGEEGELVHRGALVALGYWRDPERTAQRFRPAPDRDSSIPAPELAVWSGDRVRRDQEGFIYFVGREDEMIKTSGYRVSPTEVEEAAHATGLVGEACALGLEDERLGQRILLFASPPGGGALEAEELMRKLRRELPTYMLPERIVARDGLPRSPNGKLDRGALRRELAT